MALFLLLIVACDSCWSAPPPVVPMKYHSCDEQTVIYGDIFDPVNYKVVHFPSSACPTVDEGLRRLHFFLPEKVAKEFLTCGVRGAVDLTVAPPDPTASEETWMLYCTDVILRASSK